MIQIELINKFKEISLKEKSIDAVILYGSMARKTSSVNSDIDIAIQINSEFNPNLFVNILEKMYSYSDLIGVYYIKLRNKIVVYFDNKPKIEIAIISDIEELRRNYIGSNISIENILGSVLVDKKNKIISVLNQWSNQKNYSNIKQLVDELVSKFIYEFESCSTMHSRSDSYQFYYFYNIAFHVAVQLKYLSEGKTEYYYLPKKMTVNVIIDENEKLKFYEISGTTYLRDANKKKRLLLNFFYSALDKLGYAKENETKEILEKIYNRDFLWNFRDIAKFNKFAKPGKIYRTSALTSYQNVEEILDFLKNKNILTIIDLRAEFEIEKNSYNNDFIKNFNYIFAPFDPWNQPEWFKKTEHYGTNTEIAYRFFVIACKDKIKIVFDTIYKTNKAIAIHCLAGKDRTGFIIMLINMLIGTPYEIMLEDYLASELDAEENKFKIYYNHIVNYGGIEKYLKSCGISKEQMIEIIKKLRNGKVKS